MRGIRNIHKEAAKKAKDTRRHSKRHQRYWIRISVRRNDQIAKPRETYNNKPEAYKRHQEYTLRSSRHTYQEA